MSKIATFIAQFFDPIRLIVVVLVLLLALLFIPKNNMAIAFGLVVLALLTGLIFQLIFFPNSPDVVIVTGILATCSHFGIVYALIIWWRR